jgi:hypothetical protein
MDGKMLMEHLRLAEAHVTRGNQHIARQRELISQLKSKGLEIGEAVKLLTTFEEAQALHVADRDRIRAELSSNRGV